MVLLTKRCVLRPLVGDDARRLHGLWTSAGVRRFLWDNEIVPFARTEDLIAKSERMFEEQGAGLWGAWPAEFPDLGGFAGLWPFRDPPELELLYGVAEPLWSKGYATEIAAGVIAHCFGPLAMPLLRASTDTANAASRRVLEKLGFSLTRQAIVGGLDTVFYELPRDQSRQRSRA
jgi:ribosomal-protein-alanine N-acetyltransferase